MHHTYSNKLSEMLSLYDINTYTYLHTAPHSPRRQKLNLRMKSLSLDSPESTELHGHIKRRYPPSGPVHFNLQSGSAGLLDHNTPPSNNSRLHCKFILWKKPIKEKKFPNANMNFYNTFNFSTIKPINRPKAWL